VGNAGLSHPHVRRLMV